MNKRKKRLLAAGLAVLLLGIAAFDMRLKVQTYTLDHPGVESPVRIALVTDLHACYYGKDQAVQKDKVLGKWLLIVSIVFAVAVLVVYVIQPDYNSASYDLNKWQSLSDYSSIFN